MSALWAGGPAFPHSVRNDDGSYFACESGMTLRDWFAAHALTALIQMDGIQYAANRDSQRVNARIAYEMADAMLAARSKP